MKLLFFCEKPAENWKFYCDAVFRKLENDELRRIFRGRNCLCAQISEISLPSFSFSKTFYSPLVSENSNWKFLSCLSAPTHVSFFPSSSSYTHPEPAEIFNFLIYLIFGCLGFGALSIASCIVHRNHRRRCFRWWGGRKANWNLKARSSQCSLWNLR